MSTKENDGDSSRTSQADIFRRLHPRAYLERFVAEGFRPDGREMDNWRDLHVNIGKLNNTFKFHI